MPRLVLLAWLGLACERLAAASRVAVDGLGTELQAGGGGLSSGAALAGRGNLSAKACPEPGEQAARQAGAQVQSIVDALAAELPDWAPCGAKVFAAYNSWSAGVMQLGALYTICSEDAEVFTADSMKRAELYAESVFESLADSVARMRTGCEEYQIYGVIMGKLPDGRLVGEDMDPQYRLSGVRYIVDPRDVELMPLRLHEVATYITKMQCVRDYASAAAAAIGRLATRVLGSIGSKLKNFAASGSLSLTLTGGLSWRGFTQVAPPHVAGHSGRLEGTLGLVLLPLSQMGTLWAEGCTGKDSNKYSGDVSIGLELAFENECYAGSAVEVGVAFQGGHKHHLGAVRVGAGQEISAAVSFALPWNPAQGFPELDSISLGYGVTVQGGDGSKWNPVRDFWAASVVACNQREVWRSDGGSCPYEQECSA